MITTIENPNKIYSISSSSVQKILPELIKQEIPLRRMRKDGTFRFVPLNEYDHFLKDKQMTFYLDLHSLNKLKQGIINSKNRDVQNPPLKGRPNEAGLAEGFEPEEEDGSVENILILDNVFRKELDLVKGLSIENRVTKISENNNFFNLLVEGKKHVDPEAISKAGELFAKALCINKVTFEENHEQKISDEHMTKIILETYKLINNLLENTKKSKVVWKDLSYLQYIKSGSESLDHMVRLLMLFIPFLYFYNLYFKKYSTEIKKFRAYFNDTFFHYYNKIIKDTQKLNLEIVFKDGISPITNKTTFIEYCMGVLIHDLGKYPEINYNNGSEGYNPGKDRRHVFDGFNILSRSSKFKWNILSTMLLHHDYYGAPFGYRQISTFREKFADRRKKPREESNNKYLISYNIMDVGFGNSHAYFPNKVLEIVDLYDSLTKQNGDKYTVMDALTIMKTKYIEGEHLGIDPILFNIFIDFLHCCRIIMNPSDIKQLKIAKSGPTKIW